MTPDTQNPSNTRMFHVQPGEEVYVTLEIPEKVKGKQLNISYCVKLTYEDLLNTVRKPKTKLNASRKSKSREANLSRHVCLLARAIETGKWSTGASMMRPVALSKLLDILMTNLDIADAYKLTPKAKAKITKISKDWTCMSILQANQVDYFMQLATSLGESTGA